MFVFQWIGIIVVALIAAYFLFYNFYKRIRDDLVNIDTVVTSTGMPNLRPIPIPTQKQKHFWAKLLVMIYEVRRWELQDNWFYELPDGTEIILPKGFTFNGASIPRPFWSILSPVGLLLIPGLIHDYGYRYNQLWTRDPDGDIVPYSPDTQEEKEFWDDLFFEVGTKVNGLTTLNRLAAFAVLVGGRRAWDEHRQRHAPPEPPLIT